MASQRRIAYRGSLFTIAFARDHAGHYPAEEFFDALNAYDRAKLMKLFSILADQGKHNNPEKFGFLEEGIFEFKSFQIRMPYAYAEKGVVVITHGFRKKKDKAPPSEIARAKRILEEDAASANIHVISDHKSKRR